MKNKKSLFLLSFVALVGLVGCKGKNKQNTPSGGEGQQQPSGGGEGEGQGGEGQGGGGGQTDTTPEYEKGDKKAVDGVGLMFEETVGFNTKDATVFDEDENTRYVIYASNEVARGKQVFAARKATKEAGAWKYGEKHIILRASEGEDAWDKAIFQPSVIKGEFQLGETKYAYLMAYQGNEDGTNYNNHIGLAVSNDVLGEWVRVGDEPVIENPELYEGSFGFGSPELVSFDGKGKAYLFYSFGETLLSGTRVKSADFSDLEHINLEAGYAEIPVNGLIGRDDNITSNAGFAINHSNKLYIANDGMPSANAPGCATAFEVAEASLDIIQEFDKEWTSIERITSLDTMDDEKLGWDELFSPSFVRDAHGYIDTSDGKLEIVYSTFDEDAGENARYTGQLCLYEIEME